MKKFENIANKINAIKKVFNDGEHLRGKDIVDRLKNEGYNVNERNIVMFMYHRMLHKHVQRKVVNGFNLYSLT